MAPPARQRILDAAARLLREKGVARLTTREIAVAADAAEGSITKNFGGKLGLLTALLSTELPELDAWRKALPPPWAEADVEAFRDVLVVAGKRAVDYYSAALPLVAGAVADATLFDAYRATNARQGTGPQLAIELMTVYFTTWQQAGVLHPAAEPEALAVLFCGAAQIEAWTDYLAGPDVLPGTRNSRFHSVIASIICTTPC